MEDELGEEPIFPSRAERRREIGRFIRDMRTALGLKQHELMRRAGLRHATTMSGFERGAALFPESAWPRLADALGVDRKDLCEAFVWGKHPVIHAALFGARRPKILERRQEKQEENLSRPPP